MKSLILQCRCAIAGLACLMPLTAQGVLPAPFNVVYGYLYDSGRLVSQKDTNYVVEARLSESGVAVAHYRVGVSPAAGRYSYFLDLAMEELDPKSALNTSLAGEKLWLVLLNNSGVLNQAIYTVHERGAAVQVDLGSADSDNNGLPDSWEIRCFGQKGQNPSADPDGDGLSNLQEYQEGLNPLVKDMRHPADLNPKDHWLTMPELVAYAQAYTNRQVWPLNPNPIAQAYLDKAEELWRGGEYYALDTNVLIGAPGWWRGANPPAVLAYSTNLLSGPQGTIVRSLPTLYNPGQAFTVTNQVTPSSQVSVYALEEQVPPGWMATNISDRGSFDTNHSKVKWGPYYDHTPRQLTYSVVPTADTLGRAYFAGAGCLDGAMISITGTNYTLSKINHSPVVSDDTLTRSHDLPLIIPVSALLANDTDPDEDALVIRSVDSLSGKGATILLDGNQVKYLPPQNFNEEDTFKYIVSDNRGGLSEGNVNVFMALGGTPPGRPPMFTLEIKPQVDGAMRMSFQGYPNWDYEIQATTNLLDPHWITIGYGVTQGDGSLQFVDPEPERWPIRFYRIYEDNY